MSYSTRRTRVRIRNKSWGMPTVAMLAPLSPDEQRQVLKEHLLPILKYIYPLHCYDIINLLLDINGIDEWISIIKHIFHSRSNGKEAIALLEAYHKKEKLA